MFEVDKIVDMEKHRDYEHTGDPAGHFLDNNTRVENKFAVYCNIDPVTGQELTPSEVYWIVEVEFHGAHASAPYWYLIPAESDNSAPNKETFKETFNAYVRNPVDGGREVYDYIDVDETADRRVQEIAERFTDRIING